MNKAAGFSKDNHNSLKTYRQMNSLSQEQLAEQSGISIRTIQRIEKGIATGSAFTLKALANTLHISTTDLKTQKIVYALPQYNNQSQLKWLNLSVLSVLLIPLTNIIIPVFLFWKNKTNEAINTEGRRVISFQILWTLVTLFLMLIIPAILLLLFQPLRGGSIPLFVPVYAGCVILNIYCTIRFAISINNQSNLLDKVPNIL